MTIVKFVPPALLNSISEMVNMSLDDFMRQAVNNWAHLKWNPLLYANYKMSSYYAERDHVIVYVDPNGPLEGWLSKNHRHLGRDSSDHNFTKRWGTGGDKHMWQYLLHNRPGKALPGLQVTLGNLGKGLLGPTFENVQVHDEVYLYAVLRDLGCRALPVQVFANQADAIKKAFGAVPLEVKADDAFLQQYGAAITASLNLVEPEVAIGGAMKIERGLLFGVPPDDGELSMSIEPPTGNLWSYEGKECETSELFSLMGVSHPALLVLAHRMAVEHCLLSYRQGYPKPSERAVASYMDIQEHYGHLLNKAA